MIDGESGKAELLQSSTCSSGDITSYSDVYLIKISQDLTEKSHMKLQLKPDVCTITLKDKKL